MNALKRWGARGRAQVEAKLGRCSRCMRASLVGALAGGGLLVAVLLAGLPPLLVGAAAVLAAAFAVLVVAHAGAYVYYATHPTAVALGGPCCGQRRAAQRPRFQLQRRPLAQALVSLPAAFGLARLVPVPGALAQSARPPGTRQVFSIALGGCTFSATFAYDFDRLPGPGGKIQVTRFRMTWDQGGTDGCDPSIDRGNGAFDFQCPDGKECKLTGGNIWQCACDTLIKFVPLGTSTEQDCTCPNEQNRTAYAQGLCGAPYLIEKACDFRWIDINFRHKVTCTCATGGILRGDLVVVAQFRDGVLTFGGNAQR